MSISKPFASVQYSTSSYHLRSHVVIKVGRFEFPLSNKGSNGSAFRTKKMGR